MKTYEIYTVSGLVGVLIAGVYFLITDPSISSIQSVLSVTFLWIIFFILFSSFDNLNDNKKEKRK